MKKNFLLGTAVCALAAVGFGCGSVSAAGTESILVKSRVDGESNWTTCSLYYPSSSTVYTPCDSSYGSYDASSNKLTLGAAINGLPNGYIDISNIDSVTVSANSDIESAFNTLYSNLVFDFGDYAFTEKPFKTSDSNPFENTDLGDSLEIDSGTIEISRVSVRDSLKIKGGKITTSHIDVYDGPLSIEDGIINIIDNPTIAIQSKDDMTISGGSINISECSMGLYSPNDGELKISGGSLTINNVETSGISGFKSVIITGGEINIKSAVDPAGFGILLRNDGIMNMAGGELSIDDFDWGISGNNSKIYFNDGTTIIKNSKYHSIWIVPAKDPENDIVFGEGMGIKEDTYVFWGDGALDGTGIAESGTVTIAKGYTYRKHYGWESIDDGEESDVKVPDTGLFSSDNSGAMIAALSVGTLMIIAGGAYIVSYIVKRCKNSVKFDRKLYLKKAGSDQPFLM